MRKQRLVVSLDPQTLRTAESLAARRGCSLNVWLEKQIESLVGGDEAYQSAERQALAILDTGFHLGCQISASRDEWHER